MCQTNNENKVLIEMQKVERYPIFDRAIYEFANLMIAQTHPEPKERF